MSSPHQSAQADAQAKRLEEMARANRIVAGMHGDGHTHNALNLDAAAMEAGAAALRALRPQPETPEETCRKCGQSVAVMRCLKTHYKPAHEQVKGSRWCPGSGDNIDALRPDPPIETPAPPAQE